MADDNAGQKMRTMAEDEAVKKYLAWLKTQQMKHSIESANKYIKSQSLGPMGGAVLNRKIKQWEMDKIDK